MRPITQEWVDKAEEDWNLALMSYRARKHPSYNDGFSLSTIG